MTGTGTQADPYIPTTLTEFIEAVGSSGAYVELDRDIDASEDPNYGGELTERVEFMATQVAGGGFVVRGVTVRAPHMIYVTDPCVVQDIDFRDWAHKKTVAGYATIQGYETGSSSDSSHRGDYFERCRFSLTIDCFDGNQLATNFIDFHDCALDIKLVGAGAFYCLNWTGFLRCTIKIDGIYSTYSGSIISSCTFVRSALILENVIGISNYYLFSNPDLTYSYIAYTQSYDARLKVISGMGAQHSVVAVVEGQNVDANGCTIGTIDQMKDKDWLTSVGFLP